MTLASVAFAWAVQSLGLQIEDTMQLLPPLPQRGRAVFKCRARKVEITLLNAVGEGRNASVQREFRGG